MLRLLQGVGPEDEESSYDIWQTDDDGMLTAGPKAVQISQTIAVTMSLMAASAVAMELVADQRAGVGTSVTRILLGIMTGIILSSAARMFGVFAIPQEYDEYFAWGAEGSTATCTLQGSAFYFGGLLMLFYDVALSITYVLMVRYNWSNASLWKIERIVHPVIGTVVIAALISALVTQSFNQALHYCWAQSIPYECGEGVVREDGSTVECLRGEQAYLFIALFQVAVLTSIVTSAAAMITLYCTVRNTEKRNLRYSTHLASAPSKRDMSTRRMANSSTRTVSSGSSQVDNRAAHRMSRQVGFQAILYVSAVLVSMGPAVTVDLLWIIAEVWSNALYGVATFLSSSVGVLYLILQLRRRQEMRTRYGKCVQSVFSTLAKFVSWGDVCCGCLCQQGNSRPTDEQSPVVSLELDNISSKESNNDVEQAPSPGTGEPHADCIDEMKQECSSNSLHHQVVAQKSELNDEEAKAVDAPALVHD